MVYLMTPHNSSISETLPKHWSTSAECVDAGHEFFQTQLLPPGCQEVGDPLAGGGDWSSDVSEFTVEDVWDDSVEHWTKVHKQDPIASESALWVVTVFQYELQSHVDCIVHWPVCSVNELERACDVLQLDQHQSLKELHHHRCQSDRPVLFNPVMEIFFFFWHWYAETWEGVLYWGCCNLKQHIWSVRYDIAPKS